MLFENLNIIDPILKALKNEGYTKPTPIQEQSIPAILEGKDLLGCAQTGTGKTAAFAIPILQLLYSKQKSLKGPRSIKALVLAPTRELAIQIGESFNSYGKYTGLKNTVIFGGVSQKSQTDALMAGVDILIATPGRLIDLMQQKYISLNNIKFFVLDEADRMLDMGLGHDVKRIIAKLPKTRQTMLFSATMPQEISKLIESILVKPVKVEVTPVSSTIDTIKQAVYLVEKRNKKSLLIHLLKDKSIESVLVFSRTKHGANKITGDLIKVGIEAQAIHGNKSQNARQLALSNFKEKKIRVLVATDIAARGIDVEELSHVINFDLPDVPETYVHRIGRTGRAGLEGIAVSFCDEEDRDSLKNIEKTISKSIPVIEDHPYLMSNSSVFVSNSGVVKNRDVRKKASGEKTKKSSYFRKNKKKS
ncbi:DEAD/DEAH box helicase [Clostridium magnum]|uniref:ATP-dependent RNA helicase CshA n=1 Tax=Clostridium magnum DSM 2767 TaxID=1121326 RepID=A0A162SAD5_9CLOT|nr:DEAD/DEAH box helicase [Clostridium magnum]KZL90977.1 ATP-dependent RNA helicase RhlE [Clostridium magnum DSM 2767]SHI99425.1 ATP-dependent RNA helicase RhlE [Clostridium magnum DSM 2767]